MRELNKSILHLELPERMRYLPIDDRGYPVPKFVPKINGKWEFRGFDPEHMVICVRHKKCWLCGNPLGKHLTFPIGPMCMINRCISEPPSHLTCAEYGVRACPFLANPAMRRNEKNMPAHEVAGISIRRNPGVIALWTTLSYRIIKPPNGGVLFEIGDPEHVEFYCEGRRATREEILHSIETGLPFLRKEAAQDGPGALQELDRRLEAAMKVLATYTYEIGSGV